MERRRHDRYERDEERQESGGAQVLWERRPAWGLWERAISETCGCCGEGEGRRGIPFVWDGEGPVHSRIARFRQVPSLLCEDTAAHCDEHEPAPGVCNGALLSL
jgi:hypothetical protein